MGVPGYCDKCGIMFDTGLEGDIWLDGIKMVCPKCRQASVQPNAAYSTKGGRTLIVAGEPLAWEKFAELTVATKRAIRDRDTLKPEDFIDEITQISPEFGEKLRKKGGWKIYALIAFMIFFLRACESGFTVDIDVVINHANEYVEETPPEEFRPEEAPMPFLEDFGPNNIASASPVLPESRQVRRRKAQLARKRSRSSRRA